MAANRRSSSLLPFLLASALPLFHSVPVFADIPWIVESPDPTVMGGADCSLVLDDQEVPHIAYYDAASGDLRYAVKAGVVWAIEDVDTLGNVGAGVTLRLDGNGNPHMMYLDRTDQTTWEWQIKYATRSGSPWSVEIAYSPGHTITEPEFVLDSSGRPHFVCGDIPGPYNRYGYKLGGSWFVEHVADSVSYTRGVDYSLALDGMNRPHITYTESYSPSDLKLATKSDGAWSIETIATEGGRSVLVLDEAGSPRVAYYYYHLYYATQSGGAWSSELVDDLMYSGTKISLALDSQDRPHIAYADSWGYWFDYAYKVGDVWSIERSDDLESPGRNVSLVLDAMDNPHIGYSDGVSLAYAKTDIWAGVASVVQSRGAPSVWPSLTRGGPVWISMPDEFGQMLDVTVFDTAGREVKMLAESEGASPRGRGWNLTGMRGEYVAPGVYFLSVCTEKGSSVGKVILVR
ncbi:hypothetical protein ACFL6M_03205 [Candidatus Eisenbacteria bacterium]|uniref:FlgD Ig-like domain-containing protein n=1 Tax=Eiseniibacteriota bacterium TaxID=2212470 RepID=A0ABV6YJR9_UNCEI